MISKIPEAYGVVEKLIKDTDSENGEREQIYKASGKIIKTTNTCQSAEGDKNGLWTTTIAVAVFL